MTTRVTHHKSSIRATIRSQAAGLSEPDIVSRSERVIHRLGQLTVFGSAVNLLVYVSTGHEVKTHGLIRSLLARGRRVSVPYYHTVSRQYMAFEIRDFDTDLHPGRYGILEPRPEPSHVMGADRFDVVLAPGLAFDLDGHRLGRGTGYFDRILNRIHGARIGLAFDFQIVEDVPVDAHDAAMDYIVTETKTLHCQGSS